MCLFKIDRNEELRDKEEVMSNGQSSKIQRRKEVNNISEEEL